MKLSLASLQWFFFILANSIVAPIAIGFAFNLSAQETAEFIQRTLFVAGLGSLLQVLWGHKLPIMEGPAGMWWPVFFSLASLAPTLEHGTYGVLQNIVMGFILSGIVFMLLSLFKLLHYVKRIITPLLTGTFLVLLVTQLSGSFIKGILGIDGSQHSIDWSVGLPAIFVLVVSIAMAYSRFALFRSYSVLFGLLIGWLLFTVLGIDKGTEIPNIPWFSLPEILPWGPPQFDVGILLTAMVMGIMMLTNLMTSIQVIGNLTEAPPQSENYYNRSSFVLGINHVLAGLFSTAGFVPVAFSAGFIITTRIKERLPFIIGSFLIFAISFFPVITHVFSLIPVPVGFAVSLLSFSRLMSLGIKEYASGPGNERQALIIGISLMIGMGCMFISSEALTHVPTFLVSVLNNGMIMGVLACILLFLHQWYQLNRDAISLMLLLTLIPFFCHVT